MQVVIIYLKNLNFSEVAIPLVSGLNARLMVICTITSVILVAIPLVSGLNARITENATYRTEVEVSQYP